MAPPSTAGRGPATRRRPEDLRRTLLDTAERVIAEHGQAASAELIAREAGVSRSVLYRHFENRDELVTQAALGPFVRFLDEFRIVCQRQADDRLSDWELERAFMTGLVDHFRAHRDLLETVLSDRSVLPHAQRQTLRTTLETMLDEITTIVVEEIRASGRTIPLETVGVKLRLEIAMVAGIVSNESWLLPSGANAWTTDELLDHLTEFTLYGAQSAPERSAGTPRRQSAPGTLPQSGD